MLFQWYSSLSILGRRALGGSLPPWQRVRLLAQRLGALSERASTKPASGQPKSALRQMQHVLMQSLKDGTDEAAHVAQSFDHMCSLVTRIVAVEYRDLAEQLDAQYALLAPQLLEPGAHGIAGSGSHGSSSLTASELPAGTAAAFSEALQGDVRHDDVSPPQ